MGLDIKKLLSGALKTTLPYLGAALPLPPPFGNMATAAIGGALGVDIPSPDKVQDAIAEAAKTNPNILVDLKKAELDFASKMKELGFDSAEKLEEIAQRDRADARQREIAVKDKTNRNLAYAVVSATFFIEGYLLFHGPLPMMDGVILGRVLGTLDAALMLVLSYYYGSSAGSARKTDIMADGK